MLERVDASTVDKIIEPDEPFDDLSHTGVGRNLIRDVNAKPAERLPLPTACHGAVHLQKKLLDSGPYIIMFQLTSQRADRAAVSGFVQGPSADVTYYNLATK